MLSIIVPIYNTEQYLSECIDSILAQTYCDFELLLIDDGSTDKSLEICNEFQKKDTRVKVFHKNNSGVSDTRNYGLQYAQGEFISFCDSDDIIMPQLYECLFEKMNQYNVDRVCGGYEYLYTDGHRLYCKGRVPDGIYEKGQLLSLMIDDGTLSGFLFSGVNNSIFKREIIENNKIRFDKRIRYNEDSLFSFEYALNSGALYCLQSIPLYLYRQHNESSTKKRVIGDKYSTMHSRLVELSKEYTVIDFELQMRRRTVTEALWEILDIANKECGRKAIKEIKEILALDGLQENIRYLNRTCMNKYKKVYCTLMKHKNARLLYFISKKLVPFLSKYLSR